ncbi:MAG: DnaB-like helicase C-terminal domain-containing protein [Planctomycetota bacterium]
MSRVAAPLDRSTAAEFERMAREYAEVEGEVVRFEIGIVKYAWLFPEDAARCARLFPELGQPEDFRRSAFGRMWKALIEAANAGQAVADPGLVCRMASVSPADVLEVLNAPWQPEPSPVALGWWLRALRQARIAREEASIARAVASGNVTWEEGGGLLEALRAGLGGLAAGSGIKSGGEAVDAYLAALDTETDDASTVRWGFPEWDTTGAVLRPGDYCVMAAAPGTGKTTLALRLAYQASKTAGRPVLFYLLEDTTENVAPKLVHMESGIPQRVGGKYDAGERAALKDAAVYVRNHSRLLFVDSAPRKAQEFCGRVLDDVRREAPILIVVDYLGCLDGRGRSEYERVTDATKALCALAVDARLPVLTLHQLRRHSQDDKTLRRPRMTDLRGSGQIEQDATHVVLGWDPTKTGESTEKGAVWWQMAKARRGQAGPLVRCHLDGARSQMCRPLHSGVARS